MTDLSKMMNIESVSIIKESLYYSFSSENGGAIFIDNSASKIDISYCTFIRCAATSRGGGIAVFNCQNAKLKSSCFVMNSADAAQGFIFWSDVHNMLENSVNHTSEISPGSRHASSFGGETRAVHSYNNISHYKSNTQDSGYRGWLILGKTSPFSFKYAELYNCTVFNTFGIHGSFNELLFEYMNIIKCQSTNFLAKYGSPRMKMRNILFISSTIPIICTDVSWITQESVTMGDNIERYAIKSIKCGTKTKICSYKYRSSSHIINYSFLIVILT